MQSSLSELFIAEHEIIKEAGDLIRLNNDQWKTDPVAYEQLINQLLGFFAAYADKFHHIKEEEILFPAISKKSEIAGIGIVSELMDHHEEFRLLLKEVRAALDRQDYATTQQLLGSYIQQLNDHIAAENDEVFPMADDIFSRVELDMLYCKCADLDREMGLKQKEEWEDLIKKLTGHETAQ